MNNVYDLFGSSATALGPFKVVESRDRPRYTLPEEVIPGVPWPPGFRDEFNDWSWDFLGTTNIVERGHILVMGDDTLIMCSDDMRRHGLALALLGLLW